MLKKSCPHFNMKNNTLKLGVLAIALVAFSGCADSVSPIVAATMTPVGFWYGLWHGTLLPFAWLVSLFNSDVTIYATYNNGGWYNFGFVCGVGMLNNCRITIRKW
jgi:hypothetical protein